MGNAWVPLLGALICSFLNGSCGQNQPVPPALVANGSQLTLSGKPFQVFSGAIHYFRVPHQYWKDRLLKLKACGLNTVETYVPWNLHEPTQGQFDFSGELDIVRFLDTVQSLGLYAILRPGPYICAEWDWGGHPAWLMKDPLMKVRTLYPGYTSAVEKYFAQLLPKVTRFQYTSNRGPIIMVQVENEYGAYGNDADYIAWLRGLLIQRGITELLFTSDGGFALPEGTIPGLFTVVNFQGQPQHNLDALKQFQPNRPLMVGEFWTGWFDHWGEKHHTWYSPIHAPNSSLQVYTDTLELILRNNASFNLYMFHGGTNFGFMNGANREYNNNVAAYLPTVTSYDYAGPLTESGWITAKYYATQALMKKHNPHFPSGTDELMAKWKREEAEWMDGTGTLGPFSPAKSLTLTQALRSLSPQRIPLLTTMEIMNQNHGFIVYAASLPPAPGVLSFNVTVADRAQILLNGKVVKTVYSQAMEAAPWSFSLETHLANGNANELIIMVENMGRVNYDMVPHTLDYEHKGMTGIVEYNGNAISAWQAYNLPLDPPQLASLASSSHWEAMGPGQSHYQTQPTFYQLPVRTQATTFSDSFLDLRAWGKGSAFVNSFNLGRYWPLVGPQQTLYLPAPLLSSTSPNTITLFELERAGDAVALVKYPNLG